MLTERLVRPEEILVTLNTITVLRSGERIPTRKIRKILAECGTCGAPITEEVKFHRQTGMCFACVTGDRLNFGRRASCRVLHRANLERAKLLILKYCGETSSVWRTQPYYGSPYEYIELHWDWYPEDGFLRIGYHIFRLLDDLSLREAEEAFHIAIHRSFAELLAHTRPSYLVWKERKDGIRNHNHEYHLPG